MSDTPAHRGYRLTRPMRLSGRRTFDAVFAARCRKNAGPLAVQGRPNDLAYSRLGLVLPRRVGKAVRRNRIKRLLREAFRLKQDELPVGYDLVVIVRPHEPMTLADYQYLLGNAASGIEREWQRRQRRRSEN